MPVAVSSGDAALSGAAVVAAVGYVAGALTTISYLAQVLRTLKHRSTKDISLTMYLLLCSGIGLWLIYGMMINSWPVIIANAVTLALSGAVLLMKIKFG
jgi:MtN3 and saliva related transmembrane protein